MQKRVLISFGISLVVIVWVYFFVEFAIKNFWWMIPVYVYLLYFFTADFNARKKFEAEAVCVKDCKDVRIDFW